MSLFLIYFEVGKSVPVVSLAAPLAATPVSVVVSESHLRAPLAGIAMTDGVASDRFLRFDQKVAGRQGAALRASLRLFLHDRLAQGAQPHLVFIWLEGPLDRVAINLKGKRTTSLSALDECLASLQPGSVVQVTGDV